MFEISTLSERDYNCMCGENSREKIEFLKFLVKFVNSKLDSNNKIELAKCESECLCIVKRNTQKIVLLCDCTDNFAKTFIELATEKSFIETINKI